MSEMPKGLYFAERKLWEHGNDHMRKVLARLARTRNAEQKREAERDKLRQQVEKLEHDLAECYRLTGSDPDGDSDSMLAKHAVQAVRELREEADRAGEWEERAVSAERHRTTLLGRIDKHNLERSVTSTPQRFSRDSALYQAADRVRKELER